MLERARHPRMDENSALAGVEGHDAWRERTLATVEAWRDEMGEERGDGAGKADLLAKLVAFDDGIAAFNRDLRRHARAANAADEDLVFTPGIDDLVARGRALVDTAPRPEEVPWDHLGFLEMVAATIKAEDEAAALADAEDEARFERLFRDLAAVKEGRRELRDLAKGQPLHQVEGYEAWRKGAVAAVDAWRQADVWEGDLERAGYLDTARLRDAFTYDDEVATLLADWTAFERQASERDMEALNLVTNDPLLVRVRRLVDAAPDGETPPQPLTGILARHQARIEERNNAVARIGAALDEYASRHKTLHDMPLTQVGSIKDWCAETKDAIGTWRAMTMTGERNPALSDTATILEDLIAFERRAHDVAVRVSNARGDDGEGQPDPRGGR